MRLEQFSCGQAKLHLVKKLSKVSKREFEAKFHPDNIVGAKLKLTLSDGNVVEIEADVLELLWQHYED